MSLITVVKKIPAGLRPLLILAAFGLLAAIILLNKPSVERSEAPRPPSVTVETLVLQAAPYQVTLGSYGVVRPSTQTALLPQVSGQIVYVSEHFNEGGFFDRGDVLITIDDRDFKAAVTAAEAALLQAESQLMEEKAQAKIAGRDWKRSGNRHPAPDLVLRKPQLKAAEARLKSAEAELQTARLNLDRTRISAPYAGRVLRKSVDIGQAVSPGTVLGEIYATDYVEIRLPLKNRDLAFVDLPETFRQSGDTATAPQGTVEKSANFPAVNIRSNLVGEQQWQGAVVRVEGAIDDASQQLHVVARVQDPYEAANSTPLKIGQYVTARIVGRQVPAALVIPTDSIYQGTYVYVVKDDVIERRDISIAWQNGKQALVAAGLNAGEQLVITPLGRVISGTRVNAGNNSISASNSGVTNPLPHPGGQP